MSVIDDYLDSLHNPAKATIAHLYDLVRDMVPEATEELSYAMPAFKCKGKGLVAVMENKNFLSLYSFCAIEKLGVDLSAFEQTSGSIHFRADDPIPDELFKAIISARVRQIEHRSI